MFKRINLAFSYVIDCKCIKMNQLLYLQNLNSRVMAKKREKTRYTKAELKDFEKIIDQKLEEAINQLEFYLNSVSENADGAKIKGLDDGTGTRERERMITLAGRQRKYIQHLENAKLRIQNGVYGVCRETGKLISKERLKAVPHATLSIAAKQGN